MSHRAAARSGRALRYTDAPANRRASRRSRFDDSARVHHVDHVGIFRDDAEVVRDEQDRHVTLTLQLPAAASRICAWIVTSSAVVGSSAMSSRGLHESAIAIITRCRMPPDSSCGYALSRRRGSEIPTSYRANPRQCWYACRRADALMQRDGFDDLIADGVDRIQRRHRLLEDHRDVFAAHVPHLPLA